MTEPVPPWMRPLTFGLNELLLDLIYGLQRYCQVDLESIYVLLCVQDATMRPFMVDPNTPASVIAAVRPPEAVRGAISRRMIADKTGLPRETVRRKIALLVARGLVAVDGEGRIRVTQRLDELELAQAVNGLHQAVVRYSKRLAAFGLEIAAERPDADADAEELMQPRRIRPMLFGLTELVLDLVYALQAYCKVDQESLHILLCITDATMRPFMLDPATPPAVLTALRPTNDVRGSISRRTIADKTGLARETVRRKTVELAELGLVQIDAEDRVRSAQRIDDPAFRRTVEAGHAAILRYRDRLVSFGVQL